MTLDAMSKIVPHMETGKMRVLLLTNKMPQFPKIPRWPILAINRGCSPPGLQCTVRRDCRKRQRRF